MIEQGDVYLVDFAKKYNSEFGKVRPAVILQNNFLNRSLEISKFQSVLVVPLSTQDILIIKQINPKTEQKMHRSLKNTWI